METWIECLTDHEDRDFAAVFFLHNCSLCHFVFRHLRNYNLFTELNTYSVTPWVPNLDCDGYQFSSMAVKNIWGSWMESGRCRITWIGLVTGWQLAWRQGQVSDAPFICQKVLDGFCHFNGLPIRRRIRRCRFGDVSRNAQYSQSQSTSPNAPQS